VHKRYTCRHSGPDRGMDQREGPREMLNEARLPFASFLCSLQLDSRNPKLLVTTLCRDLAERLSTLACGFKSMNCWRSPGKLLLISEKPVIYHREVPAGSTPGIKGRAELASLYRRAGGLFIYATTTVRKTCTRRRIRNPGIGTRTQKLLL
jgi:hypothetical protein